MEVASRKARGAFFTPPALVEFLTDWAIREHTDRVLEPSCGDAAFLTRAARRLRDLGAGADLRHQLHAAEIHEPSAQQAEAALHELGVEADIHRGDFFDIPFLVGRYQAVIGNPPYIRYQEWNGAARAKGLEAALAAGWRLNSLASSWAAFTIRSGELCAPDGRLALVLPAELLTVGYAAPVRSYLMDRFARVRLVVFEERIFPGVIEEVVLLLAEGVGPTDHLEVSQAHSADDLGALVSNRWQPPTSSGKWTPALISPEVGEIYTDLLAQGGVEALRDWGETDLGMVTGNNNFFTLTHREAQELGIRPESLLPISPPGSSHLRGLSFSTIAWTEMAKAGKRVWLFHPSGEPSRAEVRYIEEGFRRGVHRAYKCRVRNPWWRVPLLDPADLLLTYMNHDTPRLTTNRAGVRHLNSIHGVTLRAGRKRVGQDLLPLASLNSLTLLGAELVGRSYGGGILKIEPREADELPLPSLEVVQAAAPELRTIRPQLATALRNRRLEEAVAIVDRVLRPHWGIGHREVALLREGRAALFGRRVARSGSD